MADGGWNVALKKTGTGAVTSSDVPGYQVVERVRNDLVLLGGVGTRGVPITRGSHKEWYRAAAADTYEDHGSYIDFTIPWTDLKGDVGDTWTVVVAVRCRCDNASTTVTPRIVTAGTSTANVTGSAHASTTAGTQDLTLTSGTGDVTYRLQWKQSDLLYDVQIEATVSIYV